MIQKPTFVVSLWIFVFFVFQNTGHDDPKTSARAHPLTYDFLIGLDPGLLVGIPSAQSGHSSALQVGKLASSSAR
jgi:hypothetical protein